MTPAEAGRQLARQEPPITDEQAEQAARILANWLLNDPRHAADAFPSTA